MSHCISCKNKKLLNIVRIGKQPLSGIFLKKKKLNLKKYSLNLSKCSKCDLVQLTSIVNKKKMFGNNYEYSTALSKLMISHIYKKYKKIINKKFINNESKVLDIGSNDGTFLNNFKNAQRLFGIDPSAKKFINNYKKNINIICDFFSKEKVLKKSNNKNIKFDLITSFAMFYDIKNPGSFCSDIYDLLSPKGKWILEISYLPLMLKNLTYDQICHEHLTYYTLTVFNNLIEKNKLKIIDISFNEINGGSAEIICARQESTLKAKKNKINLILQDEKKINLHSFKNFEKRIYKTKKIIKLFLNLNSKKKVFGYGASTKGNIILNQCNIKNNQIKFICDGSKRKKNRFTPGSNIKIISKELMRKLKPDYLFVLIWSFRKEVIQQEVKYLKSGGCLVFPLPRFHLVNKFNYKEYLKKDLKNFSYKY